MAPGCRLLAAREVDWPLGYVETRGLIHLYPLLPLVPEAGAAFRRTKEFLR